MIKHCVISLVVLCLLSISPMSYAEVYAPLVPEPVEMDVQEDTTRLSSDWRIVVQDGNPEDVYAAELLRRDVETCFGWNLEITDKTPERNYILLTGYDLKGDEPALFKTQGYIVEVEEEGILVMAPTSTGRFYGIQTLRQLVRTSEDGELPLLQIKDYPALEWRGISDDISRGQVSHVKDFKEVIRNLAFYKKNLYQPYIEDMFSFDINPNIGKERGAITKSEMAEMVEEARRNHIVLCPVFECLGHQDRLLGLPENRQYAEVQDPEKRQWSFSPVLPDAFDFLTNLIDELAESTPSPFFHIGGDESYDIGEGTSRKAVKKLGVGRVHAEFFKSLIDYLEDTHSRQTMLYSDMLLRHPEALEFLPRDCILVDWHYGAAEDYPSVKTLKDAGFKYIMASPGLWSWNNFYPNYGYAFQNIGVFTAVAKRENIFGCITSSWGDNGAENLRENNLTGFAFAAAAEWEHSTPRVDEFLTRFVAVNYGFDSSPLSEVEKRLGWLDYLEERYPSRIFHRKPVIKEREPLWLEKVKQLGENMQQVRDNIRLVNGKIRFHQDHLDVLDHVARRYTYITHRETALDEIARLLQSKKIGELKESEQEAIINRIRALRNELMDITCEFKQLWLRRNKFPRLDYNVERLNRQVGELQGMLDLAYVGELSVPPEPEAVWFWYPDDDPTSSAAKGNRYFMRVIELESKPVFGEIKCWADDRARVFLNGTKVCEGTWGRAPDSANVTHLLEEGDNFLAIEGYNSVGAAGILLNLSIKFQDKTSMLITGDEDWRVAEEVKGKWKTKKPRGKEWLPVKLLGHGSIEPWTFLDW